MVSRISVTNTRDSRVVDLGTGALGQTEARERRAPLELCASRVQIDRSPVFLAIVWGDCTIEISLPCASESVLAAERAVDTERARMWDRRESAGLPVPVSDLAMSRSPACSMRRTHHGFMGDADDSGQSSTLGRSWCARSRFESNLVVRQRRKTLPEGPDQCWTRACCTPIGRARLSSSL